MLFTTTEVLKYKVMSWIDKIRFKRKKGKQKKVSDRLKEPQNKSLIDPELAEAIAESEKMAESKAIEDVQYVIDMDTAIANSLNDPDYPFDELVGGESFNYINKISIEDAGYPSDEESVGDDSIYISEDLVDLDPSSDGSVDEEESLESSKSTLANEELSIDQSSIEPSKEIGGELKYSTTSSFEGSDYYPSDESQSEENFDFTTSLFEGSDYYPSDESLGDKTIDSDQEIIDLNYSAYRSLIDENPDQSEEVINEESIVTNGLESIKPSGVSLLSVIEEGHNEDLSILKAPKGISAQKKKRSFFSRVKDLTKTQKSDEQKADRSKGKRKSRKEKNKKSLISI